ncbi:MAG TPA: helix-turn-helix transcriptional regulator [Stellaceae bacterium]|jgi:transcriptional regulator with XRE-family HTH domain|nr:helix-turn-helix transcriptional regulator [Stellaceae bacterium]
MIRVKRLARPAEVEIAARVPGASNRERGEVDTLVGQRLREARLLAGLSQGQLGAHIGVTFQAVQKYESGENRLSASRLLAVAEILRRPVSFFFGDLSESIPRVEPASLTTKEIKLLRYYRRIGTEEARDWMLKLAKYLGSGSGIRPGANRSL